MKTQEAPKVEVQFAAFNNAMTEMFIQNTLRTVEAMAQVQEQAERMGRLMLDQAKTQREESAKVAQRWADAVRDQQTNWFSMVDSVVRTGAENYRKQVEAFSKVSKN